MEKIFSEADLKYIVQRGNSLDKIMQQLHYFKNGIPKINLHKVCIQDGQQHSRKRFLYRF